MVPFVKNKKLTFYQILVRLSSKYSVFCQNLNLNDAPRPGVEHFMVVFEFWSGISLAFLIMFLNTIHKLVFQHRNQSDWVCFAVSRLGYWRRCKSFYFVNNTKCVKEEFFLSTLTLLITLVQIFCFFRDLLHFNKIKIK